VSSGNDHGFQPNLTVAFFKSLQAVDTIDRPSFPSKMPFSEVGLGNQTLLSKIDKLRETNVGSIVPLPQVRQSCAPRAAYGHLTCRIAHRGRRPIVRKKLRPREPDWLLVPPCSRPVYSLCYADNLCPRVSKGNLGVYHTPSGRGPNPQGSSSHVSPAVGPDGQRSSCQGLRGRMSHTLVTSAASLTE
jgi:hypothetical protein